MTGIENLSRRETMWLHASNIILRLFLFSVAMLVWYNTRGNANALTEFALMMVLVAGASLIIEAGNPLAKGSAYFLLSAFLNEKNLRGKAYRALVGKFRGDVYEPASSNALALYSLATITYLIFLVLLIGVGLLEWLNGHLRLERFGGDHRRRLRRLPAVAQLQRPQAFRRHLREDPAVRPLAQAHAHRRRHGPGRDAQGGR